MRKLHIAILLLIATAKVFTTTAPQSDQKNLLGSTAVQEYNAPMCCRIRCSSPYSRLINGLLIFLAAFVLGFIASQTFSWFVLTKAETNKLVQRVPPPITLGPNVNIEGPVAIEYLYTKPADHHFQATFRVTNVGTKTIRFQNGKSCSATFGPIDARIVVVGGGSCEIDRDHLDPSETIYVKTTLYSHEDPPAYLLFVKYTIDPDSAPQVAHLVVEHPNKPQYDPSYPSL